MLDVIIYEDDDVSISEYTRIINILLINRNIGYHIYIFKKYNAKFEKLINSEKKKIFIINLETNHGDGIKVATIVRKANLDNMIILMANCSKYYKDIFNNRIIAFDYICKNKNYLNRFSSCMNYLIDVILKDNMFVFKYKSIIYQIPFKDINYIEKEMNIKRCIIHTVGDDYYIVSSIDKLGNILKGNFIKTHQSCIVNVCNIKKLDCISNKIIFNDNSCVSLITEKAKKEIKNRLFNN